MIPDLWLGFASVETHNLFSLTTRMENIILSKRNMTHYRATSASEGDPGKSGFRE